MYFGRSIGVNGYVTDEQWENFIKSVVTLYFPDGLTIINALGQWRTVDNSIIQEHTKIVIILHDNNNAIDAVCEIYKNKYHQESVLRVDYNVNVWF